jgi:hypothetical protein
MSTTVLIASKGGALSETACLLSLNSAIKNKLVQNYIGNRLTSFSYLKNNVLHIYLLTDDGKDELILMYKHIKCNNCVTEEDEVFISKINNVKWIKMKVLRKNIKYLQFGEWYYASTDLKLIGPTTIIEGTDAEPFFIGTRWAGDTMLFSGARIDQNSPLLKLIILFDELVNKNK